MLQSGFAKGIWTVRENDQESKVEFVTIGVLIRSRRLSAIISSNASIAPIIKKNVAKKKLKKKHPEF